MPTCSSYVAVPTTYSLFTTGGTNCNPLFVGQGLPALDDGLTPLINIGFNFNFYCTTYTQVYICTNGFIQFNIGSPPNLSSGVNPAQSFPNTAAPNGMVAFDMEDFDMTSGGMVTYTTVGTSPNQQFIVTYTNAPMWQCSTNVSTGQIVLHETTNIIEIHTATVGTSCFYGTQGIENATGTAGVVIPGRSVAKWSGGPDAYMFLPYTPTPPASVSGITNPCSGTIRTYSTPAIAGATSYSWNFPGGWQGSGTTTAVSPTVGASGTISVTATYSCGTSAPKLYSVTSIPAPVVAISASPPVLCSGDTITISASGAVTYTLNPGGYTSTPFILIADTSTTFSLKGTNSSNCVSINLAQVQVQVSPSPTITVSSGSVCAGNSYTIVSNGADSYAYSSGFDVVNPSALGIHTYTVTGINNNGCSSIPASVSTVVVNAIPVTTITANRTNICKNETALLTASGASTYLWNTSATTNTLSVSGLTATTNFTVTGISAEGCSKPKTITIAVSACTGIQELSNFDAGITLYPNPTTGIFNVKIESVNSVVSFELYDAMGRLILTRNTDKPDLRLDLSDQARGLYYMKVKNGEATQTLKIVKE